jgi:hypothetical protein
MGPRQQLGLVVEEVELFGLAGSAGSIPLRITVKGDPPTLWDAETPIRVGTRDFVPSADAVRALVAGSRACPVSGSCRR